MQKNWVKNFFLVFNISAFIGFLIYFINRLYPFLGHDYCYFLPRMMDTYLHYRVNGISIQWHTPSFGGGLPAYPNPQNIQFSLPQLFTNFLDPWSANQVSIVVFLVVGYIAFYKLGREILNFGWKSSSLGALFFIANGFIIEKAVVGHVGYQVFPLISVILYFLFAVQIPVLVSGVIIALSVAVIIHEAGFYVMIIFALTSGISVPLIYLLRGKGYNLKRLISTGSIGIILGLVLSIGKIYAVYSFMRYFPREVTDNIYNSFSEGLIGVSAQFFLIYVMGLIVPESVSEGSSLYLNLFQNSALFGIWEWDVSISIFLFILLVIGAASLVAKIRQGKKMLPEKSRLINLAILLIFVWIAFEFATARGAMYTAIQGLPVMNSLHVNPRFTVSFVLPLAILGAYVYDKKVDLSENLISWKYIVFSLGSIGFLGVYFILPPNSQDLVCDYTVILETYQSVKSGEIFPISTISDVIDESTFLSNSSNIAPYEPIFGYLIENFQPAINQGSVFETTGGYFNMTNPSSLIYYPDSTVLPFERFKVEERDMMEDFLARKQPDWPISTTQNLLNNVSLGALIVSVLLVLSYKINRSIQLKKTASE